jgi:hypothetical protein
VKQLVEQRMGGQVQVDHSPGKKSWFIGVFEQNRYKRYNDLWFVFYCVKHLETVTTS